MSEWDQQDDGVMVLDRVADETGRECEEKEKSPREDAGGPDAISYYLKDIREKPLLTFPQEQELAKRVALGDEAARAQMIEANLRLVIVVGKRYLNRGLPFSDIIEEGNLGLIRAVREIPVPARVPVQHLCVVVDQAVHRARDREPGEDHPPSGARLGCRQ